MNKVQHGQFRFTMMAIRAVHNTMLAGVALLSLAFVAAFAAGCSKPNSTPSNDGDESPVHETGNSESSRDPSISVDDYEAKLRKSISKKLTEGSSLMDTLEQMLKKKHSTVKMKSAELLSLEAHVEIGEDRIRSDYSNVNGASIKIRLWWDGKIHRNGHTDLRIEIDNNGRFVDGTILETTGIFDKEATKEALAVAGVVVIEKLMDPETWKTDDGADGDED